MKRIKRRIRPRLSLSIDIRVDDRYVSMSITDPKEFRALLSKADNEITTMLARKPKGKR